MQAKTKLRVWLAQNNMTQYEFAVLVGITKESLSRYMNGKHKPSVNHILNIHRITDGAVQFCDWYAPELVMIENEILQREVS